jgi:aryl-alcohol dehydrogenase (NADP+)
VAAVAAAHGVARAQVALAWLWSKPVVTAPIVGVTRVSHLEDAVAALELRLDGDEVSQLESPYRPHGIAGFA